MTAPDLTALVAQRTGKPPERFGACGQCPAFIWTQESLVTGLCAGCRAPKPEQRIEEKQS